MRYEFGSAGWFAALHGVIAQLTATQVARSPDFRISLCEVFLDPPASLADAAGQLAWSCVSAGRELDFRLSARDDVDHKLTTDFALAAELAHIDASEPAAVAALTARLATAIRSGKLTQRGGNWPFAFDIHNVMVRLTA